MTTKADKTTTELVQLVLQQVDVQVQAMIDTYTSVSAARIMGEVFAASYAAHIRNGALPEEARSVARTAAEFMYGLVQGKS
jgi:hypothetical protein